MTSTLLEWMPYLLRGTLFTVGVAAASILIGTVCGFSVGLLRFLPYRGVSALIGWCVEFLRAIPLLLLLFFVFFALPAIGIETETLTASIAAISTWMTVNTSEVVRGAIQSIPAGQLEAARATGLTYFQAMRDVIVPQAVRRMVPSHIGLCTMLTKDTSLAAIIGAFELTRSTQEAIAHTNLTLEFFLIAAGIYFCLCFPMSLASRKLERRLR